MVGEEMYDFIGGFVRGRWPVDKGHEPPNGSWIYGERFAHLSESNQFRPPQPIVRARKIRLLYRPLIYGKMKQWSVPALQTLRLAIESAEPSKVGRPKTIKGRSYF